MNHHIKLILLMLLIDKWKSLIFIENMPDAVGYNSAGGNSAPVFFSAPYVIMYFEEESLWIIQ